MNENEFEIDGVRYFAEPVGFGSMCNGCAFYVPMTWCGRPNHCTKNTRADGKDVIFVEVHDERTQR